MHNWTCAVVRRYTFSVFFSNLLGLVTFNYDFVVNDKVTNSGIEHWQVCKIDGQWKILSVVWTVCR